MINAPSTSATVHAGALFPAGAFCHTLLHRYHSAARGCNQECLQEKHDVAPLQYGRSSSARLIQATRANAYPVCPRSSVASTITVLLAGMRFACRKPKRRPKT